ncbi:hypothetical protein BKA56DRAFT_502754 [Ilyonectria sp. MPI-CAGE-AT-0026]|nr:hypothetical protein BKA56DRAFT_502754 [Ilyonectria sp. MPI-CAGE-AT-0026]
MQSLPSELQHLICEKLSLGDLNSVSQCSRYCHSLVTPLLYKKLTLHFRAGVPERGTESALRVLSHHLSLQCVDLRMVKSSLGTFRNLELNLCPGTDRFLEQLEGHNELKSFRLAGHVSDSTLSTFLGKLGRSCQLEELALRIGNCSNNVNIALIRPHFQSLKLLVLDYRREITDSRSSKKFHFHQVQALLHMCPHLEFLGLPVEFRDAQGRRGRRKDIMVLPLPLRHLHLRGHCVPMDRTLKDAKYHLKCLRLDETLTLFVDHGSRTRKHAFGGDRFAGRLEVTQQEKNRFCLDLYML